MEHHSATWLNHLPILPKDPQYIPVNGAILVTGFIVIVSLLIYRVFKKTPTAGLLVPSKKFGLFSVVDLIVDFVYNLGIGILGHHGTEHIPFIGTCFIFILLSNLLGLIPFSSSPTTNTNTTFALGIATFAYYNWAGFKAHGAAGYAKHFLMGLGFFGVPIALIEMISHFIRPLSLGLRLYLNLHIDHMLASSFQQLCAWLVPVPLLLFGVLVCTIQAFLFTVLTTVYVQMATEHE